MFHCRNLLPLFLVIPLSGAPKDAGQASLGEMVGQMIMVGVAEYRDPSTREEFLGAVRGGMVGGVIIFERDLEAQNTSRELIRLILDIQSQAPRPLFVAIDQEGGKVNRMKEKYGFPPSVSAQYLGHLDDADSTTYYSQTTARTLYDHGININFAPVVDLSVNLENTVIYKKERSYGRDAQTVTRNARIVVETHWDFGVGTALKHFPGHGSSTADTHLGVVDVTSTWMPEELTPYRDLIGTSPGLSVMIAHVVQANLDGQRLPATLSRGIVRGLLRGELGFDGVTFSDDMHMGAITKHYGSKEAIVMAVNAGIDVVVFSGNMNSQSLGSPQQIHELMVQQVQKKDIKESQVRSSYQRILAYKNLLGLLDPDYLRNLKFRLAGN